MTFQRGEQIACVPLHAQIPMEDGAWQWREIHPDIEYGFVTSQRGDTVFCRYWRKGQPGTLRTVANSEGTPVDCLVRHWSVPSGDVWEAIQRIEQMEMEMEL
jgi:hypothetical protein